MKYHFDMQEHGSQQMLAANLKGKQMNEERKNELIDALTKKLTHAAHEFILKNLHNEESLPLVIDLIISSSIHFMFNYLRAIAQTTNQPEAVILTEKVITKIESLLTDLDFTKE